MLQNLCPDLKKRYRLGKNAAEMSKNVCGWREKQLYPISHRLMGTSHLSAEFVKFETRMTVLNYVINALKHENMVGI